MPTFDVHFNSDPIYCIREGTEVEFTDEEARVIEQVTEEHEIIQDMLRGMYYETEQRMTSRLDERKEELMKSFKELVNTWGSRDSHGKKETNRR